MFLWSSSSFMSFSQYCRLQQNVWMNLQCPPWCPIICSVSISLLCFSLLGALLSTWVISVSGDSDLAHEKLVSEATWVMENYTGFPKSFKTDLKLKTLLASLLLFFIIIQPSYLRSLCFDIHSTVNHEQVRLSAAVNLLVWNMSSFVYPYRPAAVTVQYGRERKKKVDDETSTSLL